MSLTLAAALFVVHAVLNEKYLAHAPTVPDIASGAVQPVFAHGVTLYFSAGQLLLLDTCANGIVAAGMVGGLFLYRWRLHGNSRSR
ncbi:hypothetical protein ARC20_00875 [Stenotrophomonas panacihumi]|uniref:Uncharacterized protein n=1 Tax=Stenotrophomonas panacihumi TaxID=676599 RepID=A0A0R0ARW8_9GAMM|nr:hypothetical protein ARC20_00875 [Stenotrophomonas panacihumi]PTN55654.1 hypothetical protein C9J98_03480 [Stenotrophomonas panacihumi]